MFEIIDKNGVIHSGDEDEMTKAFDVMTNPDEYSESEIEDYSAEWEGDLKLIHVIAVSR